MTAHEIRIAIATLSSNVGNVRAKNPAPTFQESQPLRHQAYEAHVALRRRAFRARAPRHVAMFYKFQDGG